VSHATPADTDSWTDDNGVIHTETYTIISGVEYIHWTTNTGIEINWSLDGNNNASLSGTYVLSKTDGTNLIINNFSAIGVFMDSNDGFSSFSGTGTTDNGVAITISVNADNADVLEFSTTDSAWGNGDLVMVSADIDGVLSQVSETFNAGSLVSSSDEENGRELMSERANLTFTGNDITKVSDDSGWSVRPVDANGASTITESGKHSLTDSDVYWGRWSGLTETEYDITTSHNEQLVLIGESTPDDDLQLPVTGTYNYDDIASTGVYDENGNVGSLTDANMSINFYTNDVTSQYQIDMGAGANWSNEITANLDPNSGDFISTNTTGAFDAGDGYMAGTLMGDDASHAGAVYNVQMGDVIDSNMATGAVLFEHTSTTPAP